MKFNRSSGILLHPTSLPGRYGIGDLGPAAHRWLEFLADAGCGLWQVLPLGPTGYGDSPYQCFSSFAGNPYLISPELLVEDGLLARAELDDLPQFPDDSVDFGLIFEWKPGLLDRAYEQFVRKSPAALKAEWSVFCHTQKSWLDDFALFMALKDDHGGAPWPEWPAPLRDRELEGLAEVRQRLAPAVERHAFRQFLFFRQWKSLHQLASKLGVQIVGDIPIFVAHDSADVWANPHLFYLDEKGHRTVVAGVPPDYFSPTGQLWGNPLYRWEVHKASGYQWWLARIQAVLELVDVVRIDHFRGFAGYWEVPGDAKTAVEGRWVPGPGGNLFDAVSAALGELPIIAEDLGVITPDVEALRDGFGLPGMKIIQFAFGGKPADPFLPHNYKPNCVVYTGTHDNDTARGWYERIGENERSFARRYLGVDGSQIAADMIRAAWGSVAMFALAPLQDFLNLGNEARMNYPGNPAGNWTWRMGEGVINEELKDQVRELNFLYSRSNAG